MILHTYMYIRTHQHGSEKAPLVSAAASDGSKPSSSSSYGLSGSASTHASSSAEPTAARNLNLDAAYLHVLGDLVQSIGVAIAGLLIW